MIDMTPLFEAVIALLAGLITMKLLPWLQAKMTVQQQEMMKAMTRTLVYAAEQIYGAGNGSEKMQYVSDKLKEKGFTVYVDAIEAAVYDYLNGPKEDAAKKEEE